MPSSNPEYYALLGVDPDADSIMIRKALVREQRFWGLRQNAPDPEARGEAERRVQFLAEASDVLLDAGKRATYDHRRLSRAAEPRTSQSADSRNSVPAAQEPWPLGTTATQPTPSTPSPTRIVVQKVQGPRPDTSPPTPRLSDTTSQPLPKEQETRSVSPARNSRWFLRVIGLASIILLCTLGCLALAFVLLVARFRVEGAAMEPTLRTGDTVLVWKTDGLAGHAPARGEIIVFWAPTRPDTVFSKRVIGLPGDAVLIREGQVIVNGQRLNEPYIRFPATYTYPFDGHPGSVPAANYFVLGDNRPNSSDSHLGWFVPSANLIGTIVLPTQPPSPSLTTIPGVVAPATPSPQPSTGTAATPSVALKSPSLATATETSGGPPAEPAKAPGSSFPVLVAPAGLEPFASMPVSSIEADATSYRVLHGSQNYSSAVITGHLGNQSVDESFTGCVSSALYCAENIYHRADGPPGAEVFRGLTVKGNAATVTHINCCAGLYWTVRWIDPAVNVTYELGLEQDVGKSYGDTISPSNRAGAVRLAKLAEQLVPAQ
jgi:signal peptidase I